MELIGSLFLILALALVVGLFIAQPFFKNVSGSNADKESTVRSAEEEREHQRSSLLAERDRVLNALQELDFDYALGKVPAEEYPLQRSALLKTGADVLRRLDEIVASGGAAIPSLGVDMQGSAEDQIEAAVARRRADGMRTSQKIPAGINVQAVASGTNGHSKRVDELEDIIASRKRERKESSAGFCPGCGKPVSKSDKFCSRCGATL